MATSAFYRIPDYAHGRKHVSFVCSAHNIAAVAGVAESCLTGDFVGIKLPPFPPTDRSSAFR